MRPPAAGRGPAGCARGGRFALAGAIALAAATLAGCGDSDPGDAGHEPPAAGAAPSVRVTGEERQRIAGWGASVVADTTNDPLVVPRLSESELRRLDRLVFRGAGINLIRVFGPGAGTQLGTPNAAPRSGDPRFSFMRRVRRFGVSFMLTGADAPGGLKEHEEEVEDGRLRGGPLEEHAADDYAAYLARLVRYARDRIGVPFDYVAIANEPENSKSLLTIPPSQAAEVYRSLAERLGGEGRGRPTLVLGDNAGWDRTLNYARAQVAEPGVRDAASVIASHAYGGSKEDVRAVANLAREAGLEVWQTEWGDGCPDCPDDPSMHAALRWSEQIADALVEAETSAWFAFRPVADSTHGPGDGLIVRTYDDDASPFHTTRRFDVFRHYSTAGPPGSRRLAAEVEGDPALRAVAFRKDGAIALVLTNVADTEIAPTLDLGSQRGRLSGRVTTDEEHSRALEEREYRGEPVSLELPAESVASVVLRPAG